MITQWLSESISTDAKSVIILGAVDDHTIFELSKKFPSGILLFTSSNSSFQNLPKQITLRNIKDSPSLIKEQLEDFLLLDYNVPPTVKVSKSITEELTSEYNKILDLIISEIDSTMRARRTRSETGYLRQRQIFINLAGYLTKRLPSEWETIGQGSLVIIVGAGPSLDKTLPLLKSGIPKPLIIACDSSLTALKNIKLNPDFVVSIDPQKSFKSCSSEGYAPGVAVLSSQSHASWSQKWGNNCCFLSGRILTEDWLVWKGISKTDFLSINNAGLTAMMFANFLNPSVILTVGMDLSGGGNGMERYAKNTRRSHIQIQADHYHNIPGNFQDTVPTPFLSDWQETSDFCRQISANKTVINLNDRGAKLEGATLIHPKQIGELKSVLNENLKPFDSLKINISEKRKCIHGHGLNQLLCQLTAICDQVWAKFLSPIDNKKELPVSILRDILANHDLANLLGDFAFSVMPKISKHKKPTSQELEKHLYEIRDLIWHLEDAILKCEPDSEFLTRFFTEKFN